MDLDFAAKEILHTAVAFEKWGWGKATTIPFGLPPDVMDMWSKHFDHDHGQDLKKTWSKF